MKKLMFAVSAALCATVGFSDVTSANIVGYMNVQKTTQKKSSVGMVFCPVGNGTTWKLNDITVKSSIANKYMNIVSEYVQVLSTADTSVTARYTYLSEAMLKALYKTGWDDAYLSRIGWWKWESGNAAAWKAKIQDPEYAKYMVPDTVTFPVGTAMLGNFTGSNGLVFECAGEVLQETSDFDATGMKKPFFINYLPRTVDLTELSVDSTIANKYMNIVSEYVQALSTADTHVTARYTYLSEAMLKALYKTGWDDAYLSRIGWWKWESGNAAAWKAKIQDPEYAKYMVAKDEVPLLPGEGFLGNFTGSNGLRINFPSATAKAE